MKTKPDALGFKGPVNLPFNLAAVRESFRAGTPDADDPAVPGYWILLRGDALVVQYEKGAPALPRGGLPAELPLLESPLFIGTWRGRPLRVGRMEESVTGISEPWAAIPINFREEALDDQLITLAGMARQIIHWKSRSARCPACCATMDRIERTWGMRCTACRGEYYPPIHPAVIVLVRRGREFLLTRNAAWPSGLYALVSGYLEFGESLEECVSREVKEETGISVRDVRYVCSQSWPFPSQIMVGFTAEYAGGELVVDKTELEDARWFSPDDLPPALSPRRSISRYIIENFALNDPD